VLARFSIIFSFVPICIFLINFDLQAQNPESPVDISPGPAAIIGEVGVSPQPYGLEIKIAVSAPFVPQGVRLTKPDRLVFDFPGYELQGGAYRRIPVNRSTADRYRNCDCLCSRFIPLSRGLSSIRKNR